MVVARIARWLQDEEAKTSESSMGVARGVNASMTPRQRSGRSASTSDGNRDGNDGSRQRPEAAVNTRLLSHIQPELGIRYT